MCGVYFFLLYSLSVFFFHLSGLTSVTQTFPEQSLNKVCAGAGACRRWFPPLVFCVPLGSTAQTDRFSSPKKQTKRFVRKLKKKKCEGWRPFLVQSHYNLTTPSTLSYGFSAIAVLLFVCLQLLSSRTKKQALKMPPWQKSQWNRKWDTKDLHAGSN